MLEPIRDSWTIVLVGQWNTAIFSPSWLTRFIFDEPELIFEFPIAPGQPQRVTGAGIRLIPKSDRVIFNPVELLNDHLTRMESFACKLLRTLQHTPVSAAGVNFSYKYEDENLSAFVDRHFPVMDNSPFSDRGMTHKDWTCIRSLDMGECVLNLKAIVGDANLRFDFNFHMPTGSADIACTSVEGKVLDFKAKTELILSQIYGLERVD